MFDKEYRYEVEGIGQGHYSQDFETALHQAETCSREFETDFVKLEQFKPERVLICRFFNGRLQMINNEFVAKEHLSF